MGAKRLNRWKTEAYFGQDVVCASSLDWCPINGSSKNKSISVWRERKILRELAPIQTAVQGVGDKFYPSVDMDNDRLESGRKKDSKYRRNFQVVKSVE